MSLITKETLLTHLQRAEMASDVKLPIEFFRDLVYQAMPRTWVGLTYEDMIEVWNKLYKERADVMPLPTTFAKAIEAKLKSKNI